MMGQSLTARQPVAPVAHAAGSCTRNCVTPSATPTKTPLPTATPLPSTLTVTTAQDLQKCPLGPGNPDYSLRCAIEGADASGTAHTIVFAIPTTDPKCNSTTASGGVACTITVAKPLPPIAVSNMVVDGWTQTGSQLNSATGSSVAPVVTATPVPSTTDTSTPSPTGTATPVATAVPVTVRGNAEALLGRGDNASVPIQIDGSGSSGAGLQIRSASGATIRGLSITDFSSGAGISLLNAPGAHVVGNLIGVAPNGTSHGNKTGILVQGSNSVVIGGTTPSDVNVISSSYSAGIEIKSGDGTVIQGNLIGTTPGANAALGNHTGIAVKGNANTIGGTGQTSGNVISGNTGLAVAIQPGDNNLVQGNVIGTTPDGMSALGNKAGVAVTGNGNTVGGPGSAGNVISGNAGTGLAVSGKNNTVLGNVIGTTANGVSALANGTGMSLAGISNTVGSSAAPNIISGNGAAGLSIGKGTGNVIDSNLIGVSGSGSALGNKGNGIAANGDSGDTVRNNTIAYNALAGVFVGVAGKGAPTTVAIRHNAIYANGHGGIKLSADKNPTCSQLGKNGSGGALACPIIQKVSAGTVSGTACNGCTVEVYVATDDKTDRGFGEGKTFLGSTVATNGKWSLDLSGGSFDPSKQKLTATATSPATDTIPSMTSQFAFNMPVAASVNKFTAKPVIKKHVKTTYTDATRQKKEKVKAGCVTVAKLKICNTKTKLVTIHYKVPHKVVKKIQVAVMFKWHATQQSAVIGYYLVAGKKRLNKNRIPVHQGQDYQYKVPWKKSGPYQLVMVLKNGVPLAIQAR